jgi:hypothetical protein
VHLYGFGISKLNARKLTKQLHRRHNLTSANKLCNACLLRHRQRRKLKCNLAARAATPAPNRGRRDCAHKTEMLEVA